MVVAKQNWDLRKQGLAVQSIQWIVASLMLVLMGCGQSGVLQNQASSWSSSLTDGTQTGQGDTTEVTPTPTPNPNIVNDPETFATDLNNYLALSWESSSHTERQAWSQKLRSLVSENYTTLDKATDTTYFCPKYANLTKAQRVNVWANIFASMAYYESGWDPNSASVDVGTSSNKNTWSIGLLQMSVVDQDSYGLSTNYNYSELITPEKNLEVAVAVMSYIVKKKGKIVLTKGVDSGVYWAVIYKNGTYDKSSSIASMVKKLSYCK